MSSQLIAVIGDRNVGKTTYLWNQYNISRTRGKKILVVDSATEHVAKSLLLKIQKSCSDCVVIPQCAESQIVYPNVNGLSYPSGYIPLDGEVYLCDSSYYLERGYDFPAGEEREASRRLYKCFSIQVALQMMDIVDIFIFDEIELLPEFIDVIELMKLCQKELYITLHEINGLAGMNELFEIMRM